MFWEDLVRKYLREMETSWEGVKRDLKQFGMEDERVQLCWPHGAWCSSELVAILLASLTLKLAKDLNKKYKNAPLVTF